MCTQLLSQLFVKKRYFVKNTAIDTSRSAER